MTDEAMRLSSVKYVQHTDLLEKVSLELFALHTRANDIQNLLGEIADALDLDEQATQGLQGIDLLSQILDDISKLMLVLSDGEYNVRHEVSSIEDCVRLMDLSKRLSGVSALDRECDVPSGTLTLL
ncbi:MAG: hypothetical protein AAGM21_05075 [Pseudomonadota bacterium]